MKRTWDIEEIVEHFTLVSSDFDLLGKKTGATRLGFALLLKYFQIEARFPATKAEIPRAVIDYIANQLRLPASFTPNKPCLHEYIIDSTSALGT